MVLCGELGYSGVVVMMYKCMVWWDLDEGVVLAHVGGISIVIFVMCH